MAKFKIKRSADTDFTEAQLPHNRIDAFFDCIKLRWREFFLMGTIILLSMLPIFALGVVRDNFIADAINNNEIENAQYILLFFDAVSILFYLLPAVAFAGAFRVIRNIAWADIVFFKEDFKDGIRLNFKIFSFVFLLIGTGVFLVDYFMISAPDTFKGVPIGLSIMLLIPIAIFIIVQGTLYNISFSGALRNGVYLFAKSILRSVLASLATVLPIVFGLFSDTITKHICLASYMLIFMPWVCLGIFLFSCSVLDKHINAKSHPEIVGKGLVKIEKDEN